jgi:hypothetical protein
MTVPYLARWLDAMNALQQADGRFLWVGAGIFDPWNHSECLMALVAVGDRQRLHAGFEALERLAQSDPILPGDMGCAAPMTIDGEHLSPEGVVHVRDTNFACWPALALWMAEAAFPEEGFARRHGGWALDAVHEALRAQQPRGPIGWALGPDGTPAEAALLAANGAIFKALGGAIRLEHLTGRTAEALVKARYRLGIALREGDALFADKSAYAMDWYYPAFCGALTVFSAKRRLKREWRRFVIDGFGCRCVRAQPWVTAGETSELILTLLSLGETAKANTLIHDLPVFNREPHEGALMGYQLNERRHWPQDGPSWTQAALILAVEAARGNARLAPLIDYAF